MLIRKNWITVYGDEEGGEETSSETTQTTGKPSLSKLVEDHGLQEDLNSMMAENRRKLTKQNQDLIKQLQQIRETVQMTQQQRDELESRIEQLQEQFMSKEELAKREAQKFQKEHQKAVESLSSERDRWQKLYATETIQRSLQDAAIAGEALNAEQIVAMLGPSTHLSEVVDPTGQPTGRFQPLVKFNDINSEGEPVVLDLSPADAIKRMRELEKHGNLFKGTATGGVGASGGGAAGGGGTTQKLSEIMKDPVKYREWRKRILIWTFQS